jgi:hypothetical protein
MVLLSVLQTRLQTNDILLQKKITLKSAFLLLFRMAFQSSSFCSPKHFSFLSIDLHEVNFETQKALSYDHPSTSTSTSQKNVQSFHCQNKKLLRNNLFTSLFVFNETIQPSVADRSI